MSDNIFFQVEMVDTALELLLENLRHLLEPKSSLIVEVIYQVQSLYNNLCLFKEFFKDSRKRSSKNEVLKVVTRRIRDVVYQAEDIVDMLVSEAAVQKSRGVIGKVLKRLDYSGKKRSLKSINEKLKNIYEDTNKFGFDDVLDQGEKESFKLTKEREVKLY
ncbi:NBS-LRR class resistance protein Fy2-Ry2 [Abeliophyllum distichum]|uniref:NBS-LRR class resistance protein Fy2-Ry2 n=1 Tax=Abeliophyllum distichum TaxID=126358 RepID=A0ABD1R8K6_9LAMI